MMIQNGWLSDVRKTPSTHYDDRPANENIRLLVIHNISLPPGEFGGPWIEALFTGTLDCNAHPSFASLKNIRVAAHCLIHRDGEIVQFVPFTRRAWHAGQSCYLGQENCNDFSIGIELEGTDKLAYTDQQYQQLVNITRTLMRYYPGIENHITGHNMIAPERKTDPGDAFQWQRFYSLLQQQP